MEIKSIDMFLSAVKKSDEIILASDCPPLKLPKGFSSNTKIKIRATLPRQTRTFPIFELFGDNYISNWELDAPNPMHSFLRWFEINANKVDLGYITVLDGGDFVCSRGSNINIHHNLTHPLRKYPVFIEGGANITISDNEFNDSFDEHNIRVTGNAKNVFVLNNKLTQKQFSDYSNDGVVNEGDTFRHNTIKGCISAQWMQDSIIEGNICNGGPLNVGPLGEGNGVSSQRTSNIFVLKNTVINHQLGILHGARNIKVEENKAPRCVIQGWSNAHSRTVENVELINNDFAIIDAREGFINVTEVIKRPLKPGITTKRN